MANIFDIFKQIESRRAPSGPPEYLLVGLGNPGAKYTATRHNMGFIAIDYISEKLGVKVIRSSHKALCGECELSGVKVLLMKPQTFMNSSGEAVISAANFYKLPPERVIVISDDVAIPAGKVRVRPKGSSGGQKGLGDITEKLGTDAFPRIRVGVGAERPAGMDMADFVLGVPSMADREAIDSVMPKVMRAAELLCAGDIDRAMSETNGK